MEHPTSEFAIVKTGRELSEKIFDLAKFLALVTIAVIACICFVREVWVMIETHAVQMGELLMLFLYTEVVVMAIAAMRSEHEVLISLPVAIAVVALARYMVISPTHDPMHQILYAGAVFILVASLGVWECRKFVTKKTAK